MKKLHVRIDKKQPDKAGFKDLANRLEEFTLRFMDPLKYRSSLRKAFFEENSGFMTILETAIKRKQKKVMKIYQSQMLVGDCSRSIRATFFVNTIHLALLDDKLPQFVWMLLTHLSQFD